jgi:uncharacterized membrane protein HdeD (DUF308 family)
MSNATLQPDSLNPHDEECMRSHHCWPWFLVLGILLIVLGMMAIGAAYIATLATVLVFGWLMIAGGIVQTVNAFLARSWRGFFVHLLAGVLHLIVGFLMIEHPLRAAEALTLMIALLLLVDGVIRIVYSVADRFPGWPWMLFHGAISVLLGLSIWKQWPESGLWIIGLFVGIDLILNGWSWVMLAFVLKSARKRAEELKAAPIGS